MIIKQQIQFWGGEGLGRDEFMKLLDDYKITVLKEDKAQRTFTLDGDPEALGMVFLVNENFCGYDEMFNTPATRESHMNIISR